MLPGHGHGFKGRICFESLRVPRGTFHLNSSWRISFRLVKLLRCTALDVCSTVRVNGSGSIHRWLHWCRTQYPGSYITSLLTGINCHLFTGSSWKTMWPTHWSWLRHRPHLAHFTSRSSYYLNRRRRRSEWNWLQRRSGCSRRTSTLLSASSPSWLPTGCESTTASPRCIAASGPLRTSSIAASHDPAARLFKWRSRSHVLHGHFVNWPRKDTKQLAANSVPLAFNSYKKARPVPMAKLKATSWSTWSSVFLDWYFWARQNKTRSPGSGACSAVVRRLLASSACLRPWL